MEEIYLKGYYGPREWCTENVNCKSYFGKYSNSLIDAGLLEKKNSEIDILQKFVPQSTSLSIAEVTKLLERTDPTQLTNLSDTDLEKKQKRQSQPVPSTSSKHEENAISHQSLDGFKKLRNRIQVNTSSKRMLVSVDPSEMAGRKDLIPNKNYLVSFRIHEPFQQRRGKGRPSRCMQQILLLGHQPLVYLRDKIICQSDYQDVRGDISENPDSTQYEITKDMYPSSMFYFGNTFYIDGRKEDNEDYSSILKEWGKKKRIHFNGTRLMEEVTVDELEVRMGYPYLFLHQGCCEHLIIINDARLLSKKDSLCSIYYPMVTRVTKQTVQYCMTCSRFAARWIVMDSDRLAHDPTYQCESCFKMFHYIDGKKVGKFKAFKFIQPTSCD